MVGRLGVGTFVVRRPDGPPPLVHARLARTLGEWVASARAAGLDDDAIESLVGSALRAARDEGVA